MRSTVGALATSVDGVLRRVAGIAAATLPARWWPALDAHIPVTSSASASAVLTFLAAGAIGIPGFFTHVETLADTNNQLLLQAMGWYGGPPPPAGIEADTGAAVGVTALGLFTFLLLTPTGWATIYLGVTGILRSLGSAVDDPFGDPVLTGIDRVISRGTRSARDRAAQRTRESLEGPEFPDRVVSAAHLGIVDAEIVIVASRAKHGWDKGTVLLCGDRSFRVGEIEERTIAGYLRTLYPLTEHRDLEAFRRTVVYDMPPIRTENPRR